MHTCTLLILLSCVCVGSHIESAKVTRCVVCVLSPSAAVFVDALLWLHASIPHIALASGGPTPLPKVLGMPNNAG